VLTQKIELDTQIKQIFVFMTGKFLAISEKGEETHYLNLYEENKANPLDKKYEQK
jgi:hypothetical protein